jgi:predicted enzyme related to lactoylglutathione lyase
MLVNIDVPDLPAAVAFYCAALDLHCNRQLDDDVAELTGGSSLIYLMQKEPGSLTADAAPRRYDRHWCPVHIDFVVEEIDKATERVTRAGGRRESECVEWRGSKCITFSDPFGNGFCLIAFDNDTYSDAGA